MRALVARLVSRPPSRRVYDEVRLRQRRQHAKAQGEDIRSGHWIIDTIKNPDPVTAGVLVSSTGELGRTLQSREAECQRCKHLATKRAAC